MNKFKENKTTTKAKSKNPLIKALEYDLLSLGDLVKWLPFVIFCSLLAFLYIGNRLHSEKRKSHLGKLESEMKTIEVDYYTIQADLMNRSRQSEIVKNAESIGLKESKTPPFIIQSNPNE